jgi:hypothetical protein
LGDGRPLDVLSVLVGSGQQADIKSLHSLKPTQADGHDCSVRVPQVRPRVHVVEWSS